MLTRQWGVAIVRGRSMLPTLREGDRVLVHYGRLPKPGDLTVVRFDGTMVIKRLSLRDGDGWWFSRDNPSEGVDSWTRGAASRDEDVLGVVPLRIWPRTTRL